MRLKLPLPAMIALWAVLVAAPLAIGLVGFSMIPAGVERIPTHWGFDGQVNGYGPPSMAWIIGAVMAGVQALVALCCIFNDNLYDRGLVHGVSREGAPVLYVVLGVVLVAVTAWCVWLMVSNAVPAT